MINAREIRKHIGIQYPILDHTESIANIKIKPTKINKDCNKITIENVFSKHNLETFVHIVNFGKKSLLTVKAGNAYPNSALGDIYIEIAHGISSISIVDISRFIDSEDNLNLDFPENFDGAIYVVSRWKSQHVSN